MSTRRIVCAVAGALLLSGCAGTVAHDVASEPNQLGTIIDQAQIERSGARNAFEAVKRARTHLTIHDSGHDRRPAAIGSRGPSSLNLDNRVRVVVDGTSVFDGVGTLRAIQSGSIQQIQILTAREASTMYGSVGGNGLVVVTTTSLVARR